MEIKLSSSDTNNW